MTTDARWRLAVGAIALALVVGGRVQGWTGLAAVLIALPLVVVPLLPSSWWTARWTRVALLTAVVVGAVVPTLIVVPLCQRYDAWPVWWSAALRGWCGAGLALSGMALGVATWRARGPWWLRAAVALAAPLTVVGLCLPLSSLYVAQITAAEAPIVAALTAREDLVVTLPDGDRLQARIYRPLIGPPRGWALFVHGAGGWKEAWQNQLRLFAEAGWAVVAYDQRGHGRSSPAALTYGPREAADALVLWTLVRAHAGDLPLAAYGVSLGSCAVMLASPRLDGCAALILESPFDDLSTMMGARLAPPLRLAAVVLAQAGPGTDPADVHPGAVLASATLPRLLVGWIANDRVVPAAQSRAAAARRRDARSFEMASGEHLDLIVYEPWREQVRVLLTEAVARPR